MGCAAHLSTRHRAVFSCLHIGGEGRDGGALWRGLVHEALCGEVRKPGSQRGVVCEVVRVGAGRSDICRGRRKRSAEAAGRNSLDSGIGRHRQDIQLKNLQL